MAIFSPASLLIIEQCVPPLQNLARAAIKSGPDFAVVEGFRNETLQNRYADTGLSKLRWPHSKHNKMPSEAVHFVPYPIDWKDTTRFVLLAGYVLGVAASLHIRIRWGGDWNHNWSLSDETFLDLAHFEYIGG